MRVPQLRMRVLDRVSASERNDAPAGRSTTSTLRDRADSRVDDRAAERGAVHGDHRVDDRADDGADVPTDAPVAADVATGAATTPAVEGADLLPASGAATAPRAAAFTVFSSR